MNSKDTQAKQTAVNKATQTSMAKASAKDQHLRADSALKAGPRSSSRRRP